METFNRNKITKLLRVEKKVLMEKITRYVGKKLYYLTKVENLTNEEVSDIYGVPANRVTEFQKFDKYERSLSEFQLKLIIGSKMITVEELLKKVDLTEKEKLYLETLIIHEDKNLAGLIADVKKRGGDPGDILKLWLKNN